MENNEYKQDSIFQCFDIFGVKPKFFINNKSQYQTKFGAMLTFILSFIMLVTCWVYGNDLYFRQKPTITFTELASEHPERFVIEPLSFNYAVGLEDQFQKIYSDPTVYKVKITQEIMTLDTNKELVIQSRDLKAKICTQSDFQLALPYFTQLPNYDQLYCIEDYNDVYIEGDYGAQIYSRIVTSFEQCRNSTESEIICKPQEQIDQTLKGNYFTLFFTDEILDPKNYENPFQVVGRGDFGLLSSTLYKEFDYYFRNIYLEDNTGILFDTQSQIRGLQYQNQKMFVTDALDKPDPNSLLKLTLRFEKVKQTKIYRQYLNLAVVMANVGGILKSLLIIFGFISYLISYKYYNLNIVNSIFNFQYDINFQKSTAQQRNAYKKKNIIFQTFLQFIGLFQNKDSKKKSELLNFAVNKISHQLNIQQLLSKLMELEKLKYLLLNDQQRALFEYIPKPQISEELVNHSKQKQNQIQNWKIENYLLQDQRDRNEKMKDMFVAYKSIIQKQKKKPLDLKLLAYIDLSLIQNYESVLDKGELNNINNIIQNNKDSVIDISQILNSQEQSQKISNKTELNIMDFSIQNSKMLSSIQFQNQRQKQRSYEKQKTKKNQQKTIIQTNNNFNNKSQFSKSNEQIQHTIITQGNDNITEQSLNNIKNQDNIIKDITQNNQENYDNSQQNVLESSIFEFDEDINIEQNQMQSYIQQSEINPFSDYNQFDSQITQQIQFSDYIEETDQNNKFKKVTFKKKDKNIQPITKANKKEDQ